MDDEEFWLRHLRLGLVLFAFGIGFALLYVAVGNPVRPTATLVLAGVAAGSNVAVTVLPHRAIVRSARREAFFYSWTGFCIAFVLLVAAVDGGANSPLSFLLVLPVIYAGLAYPAAAVIVIAGTAGVGFTALAAIGPAADAGVVVMLTGSILLVGISAAAVAEARGRTHEGLLALHRQLAEAARRDSLTGCLTRGAFHESIASALARANRQHGRVSLLMIDLDGFKAVNDTAGHLAGDAVLRTVGSVLRSSLRAGDEAGRVGGDEFAVLLADTPADHAARAAERLLCELAGEGVASSIGVATAVDGDDTEALLARADAALYEAKRAGKGRVAAEIGN